MIRLETTDKLLLAALLPLWLVCFTLHVREVARTGIALPPVFASPQGRDAYPIVGGFHLERDHQGTGLRVGDRLIRVGETDLRGMGDIGFVGYAVENAGKDLRVPLLIERNGKRRQMQLELTPFPVPWFRIPVVLGLVALAVSVRLRARPTPSNRLAFVGAMVLAIAQSPFAGGSHLQTDFAWPIFYFGNPLGIFFVVRWLVGFPEQLPRERRLSPVWAYVVALASLIPRVSYLLGGPVPSELVPVVEHATDGLFFAALCAILAWNYAHAGEAGRRSLRWMFYGVTLAGLPLAVVLSLPLFVPGFSSFSELLGWAGAAGALGMAGFFVAIVRFGLFDIDRLISSTATYSLVLVLLMGGVLAVVPGLARMANASLPVGVETAQLALSLALAALAIPTYRRLRPRIERLFFPEREALETGAQRLLDDLGDCDRAEEVWELVDDRIEVLLRATRCVAFARREDGFVASPREGLGALHLDPGDPLLSHLAVHSAPLLLPAGDASAPGAANRAVLASLDTRVLIPFRRGKDLAAVICLSAKRSRDVYTPTDLALLGTIGERASARLRELRDAELIRQEREHAGEMRRLKEEAEQANLAKSRFLAAASHDLRQPLHALGLFVDALDEHVQDDSGRPLVDRVRRSTRSLTEMFDALLDISRLDAGAVAPEVVDFGLAPLFARLYEELGAQARVKGIALRSVPSRLVVRSDPVLFGRIVQNLLTNAIRYTQSGRVLLGARRRGNRVRVEVWDTGPGIADDRLQEIFQEFVQLEGAKGRGGLGLGLSIVERLARLLGHELEVRSVPGRGSMFAVTAARGETPPAAAAGAAAAPRADGLSGRCILVIDDDREILGGMQRLIERWGCRALLAADEVEALAQIEAFGGAPDAVLADYRLAGERTGPDVIDGLRQRLSAPVPAAIVTGEASKGPLEEIRARGLTVLHKPVRPAKLRAVLTQLLREPDASPGAPAEGAGRATPPRS